MLAGQLSLLSPSRNITVRLRFPAEYFLNVTYATSADLSLGPVIRPESFPILCAITQRLRLSLPFKADCSSVGTQNFTGVLTKSGS